MQATSRCPPISRGSLRSCSCPYPAPWPRTCPSTTTRTRAGTRSWACPCPSTTTSTTTSTRPLYKQKYKHKVMDLPLPMSKHNHKLMPKQQLRHRHLSPRLDHVCVFAYTHTSSTDMIFRQAVFRHAKGVQALAQASSLPPRLYITTHIGHSSSSAHNREEPHRPQITGALPT